MIAGTVPEGKVATRWTGKDIWHAKIIKERMKKITMNRKNENNNVFINGSVVSDIEFNHEIYGEGFYEFKVEVPRNSGVYDVIPVIVSERMFDVRNDYSGMTVSIAGEYRSFNKSVGDRKALILSVFASAIDFEEYPFDTADNNSAVLTGFICKKPTLRRTPFGRDIADVLLAVNRGNGKSDYIPCICWGRNALYVSRLDVGTKMSVCGRVQSRAYTKTMPDGSVLEKVAYEISVRALEVLGDE